MLLVVAWDGACAESTGALRAAGRMPVLDALARRGRCWRVRSTTPAVTFPAWTSFLTGAFPDHHGVTDFTIPRDGDYGVRFVNATHRAMPTLLARMSDAGLRVGMYGMPATFPPEGRGVFEICGFDTPLGASAAGRATHPPDLAASLKRRHGRLGIEGIAQSRIEAGWHARVHERLLADIVLRTRIAVDLLADHRLDVFVVHYMESDTASHHFRAFDDEASPLHRAGPRGVLADVYAALDSSLGVLLDAAGEGADVMLLSDHGSAGASDRTLFWNRWLADRGWLRFHERAGESPALRLKRGALKLLPPSLAARAFAAAGRAADRLESRARFAGIDWPHTRVYSDEVPYFPSLRLNVAGRDRDGIVPESARGEVVAGLTRDLLAMRDPFDGGPVVEAVRRREELFDGPFVCRYPDLVLELRRPDGYAYGAGSSRGGLEKAWMRRLRADEASGAKGTATPGVHGPFGMAVLAGPAVDGDATGGGEGFADCSLPDLGVTALALVGVPVSSRMQGVCLVGDAPQAHDQGPPSAGPCAAGDYSDDEEREVAERLRALGYLP